ncbi:MAG TPA: PaaI family thioesterase [Blastocatellia bacterium]|nr:PaaI family thioesterase [Blastocatellia bacterium]
MTAEELEQFLYSHFPDTAHRAFKVERVEEMFAQVRMRYDRRHLRPGGTISGPSLMMLSDIAMYLALLGMIGPVALAVTTNLNINFLRKPEQSDVIAECRLLKLGKRLAVGEVTMYSEGDNAPVAHATVTYSIPPERPR